MNRRSILATLVASLLLTGAGAALADEPATEIDGAFAEAIAAAQARTVKVYGGAIGRSPGYGTGLIVSTNGDILTAQGVFLGGASLRVTLPDGSTHPATVVRRSQELQAALLKIETPTAEFFDLAKQPAAEQGDWVLAISNAFKVAEGPEPLSVNIGVLGLRMKLDTRRGFQDFPYAADVLVYDAITSNPGAAGGAVVTADGKLVGMIGRVIEAKTTNTRLNYAVPVDLLAKFVVGEETSPMVASVPNGTKAELGIRLFALGGRKAPAYIDSVAPGGPAALAGLKTDDLVVTIAGQVVRDAGDFKRIVESLGIGQEVVVEVKRKNELLSVRVTPVAREISGDVVMLRFMPHSVLSTQYSVLSTQYSVLIAVALLAQADLARGQDQTALTRGTLLAPKAFRVAAAKVQPSLVRIEGFGGIAAGADGGGYQAPGEGPTTGIVLSSDGYIVTSTFNFLRKPPIITVVTPDGRRHVARLLGRDETRKICLLKIDGVDLTPVTLAPRDQVRVGQWSIAVGVGFGGDAPVLSAGIISATSRISGKAVQTDANTSPANYGGPLVDLDGRVIGVIAPLSPGSSKEAAGAEWYDSGIGFAVPLAEIEAVLAALKEGKTLQPAFLGVQTEPAGDPPTGAVIKEVLADSPAAKAGLQEKDKIHSVGGIEIQDTTHLATVIGRYVAGDKVEVVAQRGEEKLTLTAELAVAPPPAKAPMPNFGLPPMPGEPKPKGPPMTPPK